MSYYDDGRGRMGHSPDRSMRSPPRGGGYKVLCVSSLHPKASDDVVRDTLYREYKKYGDIKVRVMQEPDERVAYVYFRSCDDARDAKHSKFHIILFDKPAVVEPVYESRSAAPDYGRRRSMSPPPHYGSSQPYYRSRSPPPSRERYRDYREDYHRPMPPPYRDYGGPPRDGGYHHRGGGGYHRGRGGYRGRGGGDRGYHHHHHEGYPPGGDRRDNKRHKFSHYLDHIQPEDDRDATRNLFIGNLELNITEEEVKNIFGRYGRLVDIDIKRPPVGTGNAFAFIRYENLDQSYKAKLELSGQYIGKFQCKIGYGKANPTPKVWVGGLGDWCTTSMLECEFDRFGAIQKIEHQKGDPQAFIWYESQEAAQAAVAEMRGFALGDSGHRIRIDYSDIEKGNQEEGGPPSRSNAPPPMRRPYDDYRGGGDHYHRGRGNSRYQWNANNRGGREWTGPPRGDYGRDYRDDYRGGPPARESSLSDAKDVSDICRMADKVWEGGLILKNSLFPAKFHQVQGDPRSAERLKDPDTGLRHLKITQRLRLDQGKLDGVSRRMNSSNSHSVFLCVTSAASVGQGDNPDMQSSPLRNLVSYLKQKEAAGVISLSDEDGVSGTLYCFPPCSFSCKLLQREIPAISQEETGDDHLVILLVCGGNTG